MRTARRSPPPAVHLRDRNEARRRFARAAGAGASLAAAGMALLAAGVGNAGRGMLAAGLAAAGAGGGALWSLRRAGARPTNGVDGEGAMWMRLLVGVAGGVLAAGFAAPRGMAAIGATALAGGAAAPLVTAALARLRVVQETMVRGPRAQPDAAAMLRLVNAPAEESRLALAAQLAALSEALTRAGEAHRAGRGGEG